MRLLKRTWPISEDDRECDGYKRIMRKSTEEQRQAWGVDPSKLQTIIRAGERYIYQVGMIGGEFLPFSCCFGNNSILKKFIDKEVDGE